MSEVTENDNVKMKRIIERFKEEKISKEDVEMFFKCGQPKLAGKDSEEVWIKLANRMSAIVEDNGLTIVKIVDPSYCPEKLTFLQDYQIEEEPELEEDVQPNGHNDEENPEEQPFDKEKLSPKSKRLVEKVEELCGCIEKEESPFKRQVLSFRVQMLVNRIQKEIDVLTIKENYEKKREEIKRGKTVKNKNAQDKVAELIEEIEGIQDKINNLDSPENGYNPEYDPEAPEFKAFSKKYISEQGGIENILNDLRESNVSASKNLAEKIEEAIAARGANEGTKQQLEELLENKRQELAEAHTSLNQISQQYNKDVRSNKVEEKALVAKTRFNPLTAIKNVWKNIKDRWKDFKSEREAIKGLEEQEAADMAEIDNQLARDIEALKQAANRKKEQITRTYDGKIGDNITNRAQSAAENFRTNMFKPRYNAESNQVIAEHKDHVTGEPAPVVDKDDEPQQ